MDGHTDRDRKDADKSKDRHRRHRKNEKQTLKQIVREIGRHKDIQREKKKRHPNTEAKKQTEGKIDI